MKNLERCREEERHPLLGTKNSRKFKMYRTEFPAIFRFNGMLYIEQQDSTGKSRFFETSPEEVEYWLRAKEG